MFDRVHWSYLHLVLQRFGFAGNILTAVLALYSHPSARVLTSGMTSDPFDITNGTRQGCPLSPLIFALVMEPLAAAIRVNPLISGLQVGDTTHKLGLYADNVLIFLTNALQSLPVLHNLLTTFGQLSLYKVNCSKSSMLGIYLNNTMKTLLTHSSPFPCAPSSMLTYLGIQLTVPSSNRLSINCEILLKKLNDLCSSFCSVHYSWAGKIAFSSLAHNPHWQSLKNYPPASIIGARPGNLSIAPSSHMS